MRKHLYPLDISDLYPLDSRDFAYLMSSKKNKTGRMLSRMLLLMVVYESLLFIICVKKNYNFINQSAK